MRDHQKDPGWFFYNGTLFLSPTANSKYDILKKQSTNEKQARHHFGSSLGTWLPGANMAQSECLGKVPRRARQSHTSETRSTMHSSLATWPRAECWCSEQCHYMCLSACCSWQTAQCGPGSSLGCLYLFRSSAL